MTLVQLEIDGRKLEAPAGKTILDTAREAGIAIPTLCQHSDLAPNAACRVCVVEVEGRPTLQAACHTAVAPDMVVHTDTEKVRRVRRLMIELLLSQHPQGCMTCDQAGSCELQDLAYANGVEQSCFKGEPLPGDLIDDNPFFVRDYTKCIGCWRCVSACAEVQGRLALAKGYRGVAARPVAGLDVAQDQSNCEFCGQCVAYCPTGALQERSAQKRGRNWEAHKVTTTCTYCGVGCNFDLNVVSDKIVKATSNPDAPVNGMALCVKGRFGWDFVHSPERLTRPLVRKGTELVEASWDEALDLVAGKLAEIKKESGADALGVLTSAKCTNEENYVAQKFARSVLGTNNVDHCARL